MKLSYNITKKYLPYIKGPTLLSKDLIMHTAEVEELIYEGENLCDIYISEVLDCKKHEFSDTLNVCRVLVKGEEKQIVCGAPNVKAGLKVAVATIGAKLKEDVIIGKSKIRGVLSEGMICSLDEIGLVEKRQETIWEMPLDAPVGMNLRDYLGKNDVTLDIDNKAINHRPDMFSYIGIFREIAAINGKKLDLEYKKLDFSHLPLLNAINEIPEVVKRYSLLKISGVGNKDSNDEITSIIQSAGHLSKGLLIDVSNYSLYFYGQPTHIFDAQKVDGKIIMRYARNGEILDAIDGKTYELSDNDIVISDEKKLLALAGIIGSKSSCVDENTKDIYIESANFDHSVLRLTGKRLGVRTDSLNVFEKDILPELTIYGMSLIVLELKKEFPQLVMESFFDSYEITQKEITQELDLNFYNNLIGKNYTKEFVLNILENLGIKLDGNILKIPFWRKELTRKADIAEEIARIDGYDNIESTIPNLNLGAIKQDTIYHLKNDIRNYFTGIGFFDVYNYSFVYKKLMEKLNGDINDCVALKNSLSDESTHIRNSLIPNLMRGLESNIKERKDIKLFEIEKSFFKKESNITEKYLLSGVITSNKTVVYYDIQEIVSDFLKTIYVDNFYFEETNDYPKFANAGRVSKIIIRGNDVGYIGEIHPTVAKRFSINQRIGFFEIDIEKIISSSYNVVKVKEVSSFQENNFDLSFVVDKNVKGREIHNTIRSVDKDVIKKVELFDIYEDEQKLPNKRSLSFKVFIQSMTSTISDEQKGEIIQKIVQKVEKKGGILRGNF